MGESMTLTLGSRRRLTLVGILVIVLVLLAWIVAAYNSLVAKDQGVTAQWAQVENQRSEEHTSELQSQSNLVCRLLLEKKNMHRDDIAPSGHDIDTATSTTHYLDVH